MLLTVSLLLAAPPPDFNRSVAPILAGCVACHGAEKPKGGLNLTTKSGTFAGGDAGPAVVSGKPADSPLYTRVHAGEMPPKKPLTAAEVAVLKAWIEAGAKWGSEPIDPTAVSTKDRAGRDWWSLQPLKQRTDGSIDGFIRARLAAAKLTPSPPADARSQVRRLFFDLIGLPPSAEQVEAFAADPSDAAYEKLVERLLASPHYGERWARHWLDLVRYGESDGFERNAPRPNAHHYRDWVIRSLNDDVPYDRFARLQIAGDALNDPDGIKATGFLVAGIHNTVLGSNAVARETARQDELEDVIAAVGQSFLGLTVQCARCHDHKFDPVTQVDYYRLSAALVGVTHGERPAATPEWLADRRAKEGKLRETAAVARGRIAFLERTGRERAAGGKVLPTVAPLYRWGFETVDGLSLRGGAKVEAGRLVLDGKGSFATTAPLQQNLTEKTLEVWVTAATLDQRGGGAITVETPTGGLFDSIVFGEQQPRQWMAGSDFFRRTRSFRGADETVVNEVVHVAIVYLASGEIRGYRNGKPYGSAYTPGPVAAFKAGDSRVLFGLRHTGAGNGSFRGTLDEARLYDRALTAEQVAASAAAGPGNFGVSDAEMVAALTADQRADRDQLLRKASAAEKELAALPVPPRAFATVTGPIVKTHVLARGSVEHKRAEVSPGGVAAIPGAEFGLPGNAADVARRAKLAAWVASPENPLFARVMVNRLWHYHFGVGLVDTPSDFGFNGGRPSHPELLDWLAGEFVRQKFSLKAMHKLIVMSAAYRQSSARRTDAAAIDANNRLVWRKSPTRLDAEVLRDAVLSVSGSLNTEAGGPGFRDTREYGDSGTIFYEPINTFTRATNRRTIYRFSPRGERSSLLETFDCPDPSAATPRRQVTTTPVQALALWNNAFVLSAADAFAAKLNADSTPSAETLADRAYRTALGRPATDAERKTAGPFVAKHGVAALARVLFNTTEFVVIE